MGGRCETCKHWEANGKGWGICGLTWRTHDGHFVSASSKAVASPVVDSGSSAAYLDTRTDFGCVQHESKEATQ